MRHGFNTTVAEEVGVNAAVILDNIAYWVKHNYKTGRNERDGDFWTYGTHADISAQFTYLTQKQVRTALNKLIEAEYIKVGRYNKHKYDRTSWYTLTEKGESIFPYRLDLVPKRAEGLDKKGAPIQDINTNKKLDINNEDTRLRLEALANRCGIAL